ncbi:hypothetical protein SAMN04487820_101379 [Actinopolyspora mzabensis]|uniref:Uncharacterized protein n=1 Tax=Actinopolyspora mzabensis TaxID=995066 RepID=A0A1G8VY28_ACTMZ|nr:hypothetical protein [Actinopolyspora mzabensis]SDJ70395.1 hypothetical protein SAMN04487820_101379 [Actinopolyspora mzabensis]
MQPNPPETAEYPDEWSEGTSHRGVNGHLVTAVHLKPELAERIIDNYTRAPADALPPAQGIDAVNVLTQALAARRKRRLRDPLLLVLVVLTGLTILPYTMVFLLGSALLWLFWSLTFGMRQQRLGLVRKGRTDEDELHPLGLLTTLVFCCGALFALSFTSWLSTLVASAGSTSYYGSVDTPSSPNGLVLLIPVLLFLLCAAAIFTVLLLDKWVTRYLIAEDGGRAKSNSLVGGIADSLLNGVRNRYGDLLTAVSRRGDESTVLAHSGWDAFVGYGERVNAWTLPLVLQARARDEDPPVLRPRELYSAVTGELQSMWDSDLLAPGRRLRGLTVSPLLVVNAGALRENRNTSTARALLSNETGLLVERTDAETTNRLIDEDLEWVRHFQRSSVASWNSEQLVSTMFNIGCDNRTLYLEWNAYCLYPMATRYRLDGAAELSGERVFSATLLEFFQLLGSLSWRWNTLFRSFVRDPVSGDGRSVRSIRELVADEHCANEFQDLDGQRHMTLLEERTLSAVRNHLAERGFDTEGLEQHSTQIINNTSNNFNDSRFLGPQNFGEHGTALMAPSRGSASGGPGKHS